MNRWRHQPHHFRWRLAGGCGWPSASSLSSSSPSSSSSSSAAQRETSIFTCVTSTLKKWTLKDSASWLLAVLISQHYIKYAKLIHYLHQQGLIIIKMIKSRQVAGMNQMNWGCGYPVCPQIKIAFPLFLWVILLTTHKLITHSQQLSCQGFANLFIIELSTLQGYRRIKPQNSTFERLYYTFKRSTFITENAAQSGFPE